MWGNVRSRRGESRRSASVVQRSAGSVCEVRAVPKVPKSIGAPCTQVVVAVVDCAARVLAGVVRIAGSREAAAAALLELARASSPVNAKPTPAHAIVGLSTTRPRD